MVWRVFIAASQDTDQGLSSQDGDGPHLRKLKWRDRWGNPGLIRHPHYFMAPSPGTAEGLVRGEWL